MILSYQEFEPQLAAGVFVTASATVIGRVTLGERSSVWYGSVLRGDVGRIDIGARTNIQDCSVIHVTDGAFDTWVGDCVTVGHNVVLHGCRIADHVLVGMGSVVMDGAEVGSYTLIGAGSLVTPGTKIPSGCLAHGSPARVIRDLTERERSDIDGSAQHYLEQAELHRHAKVLA